MPDKTQLHVTLNDGRSMPQFGLGVWQTPAGDTAKVVRTALDAGYLAIDTAAIYRNEEGVGEAIRGDDDIFLTTKLWNSDQGFDDALRAFDVSAKKLGRETIDLYLIHWPSPKKGLFVESWKALIRLKEEGRAKSIGVSNFNIPHLQRIIEETGVVPTVNQVELHPRHQQPDLRAFHAEHKIQTESWSPLGQGKLLDDGIIKQIAEAHGKTAAQIIIRWHLDSGLVVIPKSVTPSRIQQNIDVFDFKLSDADMNQIASMNAPDGRIGPDPAVADF